MFWQYLIQFDIRMNALPTLCTHPAAVDGVMLDDPPMRTPMILTLKYAPTNTTAKMPHSLTA